MDVSASDGSRYDPEFVRFFDVAHTGAHVRAISQYVAAGELADLEHMSARSVIVYSANAEDAAVVNLVVSVLEVPCPVMVTSRFPLFLGPLDILLVATDGSLNAEEQATAALTEALRRGARVLLVQSSAELRDETRAPVLPVPPTAGAALNPVRLAYAVAAVARSLTLDKRVVSEELERVADVLDEDLMALSPQRDLSVNPAKALRYSTADACVVHTATPEFQTAAEVIARVWQRWGIPCFPADHTALQALSHDKPVSNDIFHDPFVDDAPEMLPLKVVVWGAEGSPSIAFASATYAQHCADANLGALATAARFIVRAAAAAIFELDE